ncbi:glycosyltransferase family 2 protein [Indioceanicola profundi]|uniref:glycosyltransferase family 2 protein n=1 Tax=Indioceanicola profundi TaxID=2220096 RepID=UPI000E6AD6BD|nr:glycosyltransferase family 2 protein [Indioceanicola profundi]
MDRIPVTAIVLTRNEAENLPACLDSLARFAEVVVVDSDSTDGTAAVARDHGARVVRFVWNRAYPKKKQWSLDELDLLHDWVMFVDADERVTPALADELAALFAAGPMSLAYFVRARPVVMGRVLRFGAGFRKIALLNRRRCRYPVCDDLGVATMWEVEGHYQPTVDGQIGSLRQPMLHDDRKPLYQWFERHNRYSDWEVWLDGQERRLPVYRAETRARRLAKRVFARLPCRPLLVFLAVYIARLGVLDGGPGLHYALSRAFYYWQVDYKRRWTDAERKAGRDPDLAYSSSDSSSVASPASALISSNARRRTFSSGMR